MEFMPLVLLPVAAMLTAAIVILRDNSRANATRRQAQERAANSR